MDSRAAEDLATKLKLEERFKPKLRKWLKTVSKDTRLSWAVNRNLPDLSDEQKVLESLLLEHYRLVAKYFKRRTREHLGKKYNNKFEFKASTDDMIDIKVVAYIKNRAVSQAEIIIETTIKQVKEIAATVVLNNTMLGKTVDAADEADEIKKEFDSNIPSRSETIATVETNATAEQIKLIEAQNLDEDEDFLGQNDGSGTTKTWNTILDQKTRSWHAAADGQQQPIDKPFIVKGQRLMVPGDMTLGATADNIINCRCSVSYDA